MSVPRHLPPCPIGASAPRSRTSTYETVEWSSGSPYCDRRPRETRKAPCESDRAAPSSCPSWDRIRTFLIRIRRFKPNARLTNLCRPTHCRPQLKDETLLAPAILSALGLLHRQHRTVRRCFHGFGSRGSGERTTREFPDLTSAVLGNRQTRRGDLVPEKGR